jgi:hypothetical protein
MTTRDIHRSRKTETLTPTLSVSGSVKCRQRKTDLELHYWGQKPSVTEVNGFVAKRPI